jgi:hypothetical protein
MTVPNLPSVVTLMCILFQYYSLWTYYHAPCHSTSWWVFDMVNPNSVYLCEMQRKWMEQQLQAMSTHFVAIVSSWCCYGLTKIPVLSLRNQTEK